jgi:hypothetical protein
VISLAALSPFIRFSAKRSRLLVRFSSRHTPSRRSFVQRKFETLAAVNQPKGVTTKRLDVEER